MSTEHDKLSKSKHLLEDDDTPNASTLFVAALVGGGVAGLAVDVILYPFDTLKTRLQSAKGFKKAGGFKGIYKGIGPQMVGSGPCSALFFCTYEFFKHFALPMVPDYCNPFVFMAGASVGEVVACIVKVPMEVVKQRRQTSAKLTSRMIFRQVYRTAGLKRGLYRGFFSTVLREVPFSFIQFPIIEYLKYEYRIMKEKEHLDAHEVAICGAIAGGAAAAITTPLDVVKTRIMLADVKTKKPTKIMGMFKLVYRTRGFRGLFAGFVPRVAWITLGGYLFFGVYDYSKKHFAHLMDDPHLLNTSNKGK